MPSDDADFKFGQIALQRGFVAREELPGALAELTERRTAGERISLGRLLVERGLLTKAEAREVLGAQQKELLYCTGADCGRRYNLRSYDPGKRYQCKACGARLRPVEQDGDVAFDDEAGDSAQMPAARSDPAMPAGGHGGPPLPNDGRSRYDPGTLGLFEYGDDAPDERADDPETDATLLKLGAAPPTPTLPLKGGGGLSEGERPGADTLDLALPGRSLVARLQTRYGEGADVDLARPDATPPTKESGRRSRRRAQKRAGNVSDGPEAHGLGKHEVVGEIARGGMGAILEARDPDLRREVAVKVMLAHVKQHEQVVIRFVEEAQVQGQLEHPNICPVHEIGEDRDGLPWFSMKRVRGRALSEAIREYHDGADDAPGAGEPRTPSPLEGEGRGGGSPITLNGLIEIFLKVCDGMAFAHSRGVIHRDLKPQNVMVGAYGEVLVMDWGLAKVAGRTDTREEGLIVQTDRADDDSGAVMTMDGAIIGTPAYMPPEQAEGDVKKMNERSDIYSLGAVLYEILAGTPPFSGQNAYDILAQVVEGKITPPSEVRSAPVRAPRRGGPGGRPSGHPQGAPLRTTNHEPRPVPRELEAVALKAMAKKQKARYRTVEALKADVQAWQEGRTLQAVEYSRLERAIKWVKRNKARSAVIGVAAAALMIVGGVLWWSAAARARDAELAAVREDTAREVGERVAREEQAKALRASIQANLAEARRLADQCEAVWRKTAAPALVEMPVVPEGQSAAYAYAVERRPLTLPESDGPFNENVPLEPDWDKGPKPPPPVKVPVRSLGLQPLKGATDPGALAVIFAQRARDSAKQEGGEDLRPACESLLADCRRAFARALAAAGDSEQAVKVLRELAPSPARDEALAYASGLCPLSVRSEPSGATVALLRIPPESAVPEGKPVKQGTTPVDWTEIPEGPPGTTYLLRFEKPGFAPVSFHLRLSRDLPPEAAHELAVLSLTDAAAVARAAWDAERMRLSGAAPAFRHVRVAMPRDADLPEGFVVIPAGSFLMGEDKVPVFLDTYLAASTELPTGAWMDFLAATDPRKRSRVGPASDEQQSDLVWRLIAAAPNARLLPAATLSWDDARAFLRWRNARQSQPSNQGLVLLPSQAMWEKAARGVDGRVFPWGSEYVAGKVNGADLRPVSSSADTFVTNYDPVEVDRGTSVFGLRHAAGNLWEWCVSSDPSNSERRIIKGGCYANVSSLLRLGGRGTFGPWRRVDILGLRLFVVSSSAPGQRR